MHRIGSFVAVVLTGAAFGAPAMAAPGSITGHVDDLDGSPIPGICVSAYAPLVGNPFGPHVATDDQGDYAITGLDPGTYNVMFYDLQPGCVSGEDVYLTQWFDGKTTQNAADPVDVTDGAVTSGVDATMAEPEAIAGQVTDSTSHAIYGICVSVAPAASPSSPVAFTQTNLFGTYVAKVPAGQYKVRFSDQGSPCYLGEFEEQWFHDKPDAASADAVAVVTGRTTFGVDAVMYEVASIAGHVQDEAGQPIAQLCIVANKAHVLNPPSLVPPFAQTDAGGNYVMDIRPGDWVLQFYDGGVPCTATSKWQLQYFNGKYIFDDADIIHVDRGAHVTGINVTMKPKQLVQQQQQPPPPPPPPPPPVVNCRVPALKGVALAKAKRLLHKNHCGVGKVTRRPAKRRMVGRVLASKPAARAVKPNGTKVALVVGKRGRR